MGRQTLDVVRVTSVVSLGLALGVVEDRQAGHVVADLPRGETVQVGPAVLPSVAVGPLEAGAHTGGLGLRRGVSNVRREVRPHLGLQVIGLVLLGNIQRNGTTSNSYLNCIVINLSCLSCTSHITRLSILKIDPEN